MTRYNRRNILKAGLFGAGAMALGLGTGFSRRLAAQNMSVGPKNLVIVLAYGGWDPTFVLDPKPDSPEVDYIEGDVRNFGNLPIWSHENRPHVNTFFEQWASSTAIINGIEVESLAHETCVNVVLAGGIEQTRPDFAMRVAQKNGQNTALPYLALSPHAKPHGHEAQTGQFGLTNQLMALANPPFSWPTPGTGEYPDTGLELTATERSAVDAYLRGRGTGDKLDIGPRGQKVFADYRESFDRMLALQEAARQGGMLASEDLFGENSAPWGHVASALSEGLSNVALVQPSLYWDTHAYNYVQGDAFNDLFGGLNQLMTELTARDLVNDTVVMVLSEMGRTPNHNPDYGKDHWAWTSAMVVSPGTLSGGKVIGVTDEFVRATPTNLTTGLPDPMGTPLHVEHVLGGVAEMMGIDANGWFTREALHALAR